MSIQHEHATLSLPAHRIDRLACDGSFVAVLDIGFVAAAGPRPGSRSRQALKLMSGLEDVRYLSDLAGASRDGGLSLGNRRAC